MLYKTIILLNTVLTEYDQKSSDNFLTPPYIWTAGSPSDCNEVTPTGSAIKWGFPL